MQSIKLNIIFKTLLFLISSIAINTCCWAYAVKKTATSYEELMKIVNDLPSSGQSLLVLDDDDTLTMMPCPNSKGLKDCQYIGGPAWFDWQSSLAEDSPYRVAKTFSGLLDVNALLFSVNNMSYTEDDTAMILYSLTTQKHMQLIVETARGPENSSATSRQLKNLSVPDNSNLLSLIDKNALTPSKINSPNNPFQPCDDPDARPVSYEQGIFYTSGQNKGKMLNCLFEKTKASQVKTIVFMDDTQKNVDQVYDEFLNNNQYNVVAIYYSRLENHKKAFTQGPKAKLYQQRANRRWLDLKRVMEFNLIKPALPTNDQ